MGEEEDEDEEYEQAVEEDQENGRDDYVGEGALVTQGGPSKGRRGSFLTGSRAEFGELRSVLGGLSLRAGGAKRRANSSLVAC